MALKLAQELKATDLLLTAWHRLDTLYIESDMILVYPPHILAMNALVEAVAAPKADTFRQALKDWCKGRQLTFFQIEFK